jgi:hypothetical protein
MTNCANSWRASHLEHPVAGISARARAECARDTISLKSQPEKWPKEDACWQVPRAPLTGINHAIYALQVRFMSGSWQIQVRCLSSATEFVCYDFFMVSARQKIPRWRRRAFSLRIGSFNWSVAISLKPKPHSTCPSEGKQLCANNTSLMSMLLHLQERRLNDAGSRILRF